MKWSYRIIPIEPLANYTENIFKEMGYIGYELVTVENDIAYFKKPASDEPELATSFDRRDEISFKGSKVEESSFVKKCEWHVVGVDGEENLIIEHEREGVLSYSKIKTGGTGDGVLELWEGIMKGTRDSVISFLQTESNSEVKLQ